MSDSQENATTAALRELGIPVTTRVIVDELSPGSPSKGKLRPGDIVVEVDGEPAMGGAHLRDLITAHKPGEQVRITVLRDGKQVETTVTTTAAEDGRAIVGILTKDDADYPFTVEISLETSAAPAPV